MSLSVTCPTPWLCQARSHQPGTLAAITCAVRRSTTPHATQALAPPAPTPPAPAQEAIEYWQPSYPGQTHPTGGFDSVTVWDEEDDAEREDGDTTVWEALFALDGVLHRVGGPAQVARDAEGTITSSWYAQGELHRGDGPADYTGEGDNADYWWRGQAIELDGPTAAAAIEEHAAAGADPSTVVGWLVFERAHAAQMIAAGADLELALAARDAGVEEPGRITAVATGELPLSWAIAGEPR